jgi:uncharacterized protein YndB with AHSA1/START domain
MAHPGQLSRQTDGYKVVFDRLLPHPIQKVWKAITDPAQLHYWFTDIEMDFRPGGKITFHFADKDHSVSYGEIVKIEEPHFFSWTWEHELAEWALAEVSDSSTRLVLTYSKFTDDFAVKAPAGFHDLLDQLEQRLNGSDAVHLLGEEEHHSDTPLRYAAIAYESFPHLIKQQPVVTERTLAVPVERLWQALTDKEQLRQWFFNLDDFKPEVGFRFRFPGTGQKGEQYMHNCEVTDIVPLRRLQFSWRYEGRPGYSIVNIELGEKDHHSWIRLSHHGVETFPQAPDFAVESFQAGWNEIIGKMLPDFLARETAV